MSTFQTIIVVLAAFVIGMSVVLFPKAKKAIMQKVNQFLTAREVADDREFASENEFATTCGNAEGKWKDAEIVWVGLKGGKQYDSFEELFRKESMPLETHAELLDVQRRLENVRAANVKEMYRPSACTEFPTEKMLGQKLFVYETEDIKISPRVMVTVGELDNGHLDITRIYVAEVKLEESKAIQTIDLTLSGSSEEGLDLYSLLAAKYLGSNEYEFEDKEIRTIYQRLAFYNDVAIDQDAVEIVAGRAYLKAHDKEPVLTARPTQNDDALGRETKVQTKDEILEAIRRAIPHTVKS